MDNKRYALIVGTAAGYLSAIVLLINAAKRAGLIPLTDVTQLLAPVAQLAAIVFFLAILRRVRGGAGTAVTTNIVVLAALVGVEFVINLVFAALAPAEIAALRAGPLGLALTVSSIAFLAASVWLAVALYRTIGIGVVLYGVGTVPVALRSFVPELVLDIGLVVMAAGVAVMATQLVRARQAPSLATKA